MIERGVTPHLTRAELKELGFQLIVCPLAALYAAAKAVTEVLTELQRRGDHRRRMYDRMLAFDEFGELVGLEQRYADEARYALEYAAMRWIILRYSPCLVACGRRHAGCDPPDRRRTRSRTA